MKKEIKSNLVLLFIVILSLFTCVALPAYVNADENKEVVEEHLEETEYDYTITYADIENGEETILSFIGFDSDDEEFDLWIPDNKEGMDFVRWYYLDSEDNKVEVSKINPSTVTEDVKVYAEWYRHKYTIKYDGNGATSGEMVDDTEYLFGDVHTLLPNEYKKTGYVFKGWNTEADGSGTAYADGAEHSGLTTEDGKEVVLYAQWKEFAYTITYYLNGGVNNASNPEEYINLTADITLKNPTRKGYKFEGWYSDAKFTKKVTSITKGSKGNKVLYAKWSKIKYTITYTLDGGSAVSNPISYYVDSATITLKNPTKKGYKFEGWYTDTKYTTQVLTIDKGSVGNKKLYAKWSKVKYTITYNLNNGTNSTSNPSAYYITTATISLKNPTRKGYTFAGWYSDAKFTKKVTSIAKGSTGNKVLYAKWTANKYTIKFDGNGQTSGKMNPLTSRVYDKNYSLTANAFKKTGYAFAGWNTKKDGKGTSYTDKQSIKNLSAKNGATVTLYAQWKKLTYTITYDLKDGVNNASNPATYTVTTATITLKNPTKRGYKFEGWYSDAKLTKKVTSIAKGSTGNRTLYAKWSKVKYTITYNLNKGTNQGNPTGYYVDSADIVFKAPTRTGYIFGGWYTDSSFTTEITGIENGSVGNKTIYAKWTPITYTVVLHNNVYGEEDETVTYNATYDVPLTLKTDFTNQFFYIIRWSSIPNGNENAQSSTEPVKNITAVDGDVVDLYAMWAIPAPTASLKTVRFDKIHVGISDSHDVDGYEIFRSTNSKSGFVQVATTASVSVVNKNLKQSTTYYYKVRSYKILANGSKVYSPYTKVYSAKTSAKPNFSAKFVSNRYDYLTKLTIKNNGSYSMIIHYNKTYLVPTGYSSDGRYLAAICNAKVTTCYSKNITLKKNTKTTYTVGTSSYHTYYWGSYVSLVFRYDGIDYLLIVDDLGNWSYAAFSDYEDFDDTIVHLA